ncbi:MAG: RNA polymerase factor sigma-32 [Alphaproteobacteria bacterium]|nr:RNA polymerase factor sigma-32 [Rickettsiales bacterium]
MLNNNAKLPNLHLNSCNSSTVVKTNDTLSVTDANCEGSKLTDSVTLIVPASSSQDAFLKSYIKFVGSVPYLAEKEERDLINRLQQGDELAAELLVKSHLRLVVKMAFGYYRYGLPMMDLISEGNLGLITAVRKFNPVKSNRLSTYAMWWIKAMMQNFILKSWSIVKIASTSSERSLFFNLQKIRKRLNIDKNSNIAERELDEVARLININRNIVKRMDIRLSNGDCSMDAALFSNDNGSVSLSDTLVSSENSPEEEFLKTSKRNNIVSAFQNSLSKLSTRERAIVTCRLSKELKTNPTNKCTLEAIGSRFGISSERVRQIANKAMEKLRFNMKECESENRLLFWE